jgi:hypothetical protein
MPVILPFRPTFAPKCLYRKRPQAAREPRRQGADACKAALTPREAGTTLPAGFQLIDNMLTRISLIVAIVAGLAVGVINFVQVKTVITTTRDTLNTTSNTLVTTQADLRKTNTKLKDTESELAVTKGNLKNAEEARDQALADAETQRKNATTLTTKLNATSRQLSDAQAELAAWKALGIPVEQVKRVIADLKEAQQYIEVANEEKRLLVIKNNTFKSQIEFLLGKQEHVLLPEGLKGKITAVDPKWDFVVLDVGENQGVLKNGELLVNRSGKLVAKVRVSVVQGDRCIANLIPGWKLGDVVEGDSAIPAYF